MKTYIIAEIGINHNGDLEIAKKLIDIASVAGCDSVKFQRPQALRGLCGHREEDHSLYWDEYPPRG